MEGAARPSEREGRARNNDKGKGDRGSVVREARADRKVVQTDMLRRRHARGGASRQPSPGQRDSLRLESQARVGKRLEAASIQMLTQPLR